MATNHPTPRVVTTPHDSFDDIVKNYLTFLMSLRGHHPTPRVDHLIFNTEKYYNTK
jgi:hypothetical protein